ncbi:hypothetical protein V1512DRAFT_274481 [Lipomyces arxii]|uniref:uncharacterized protein n=1 Tax=Lipomyces arxii TaxID=56418 RepID=UPI0034CF5FCB
MNYGLPGIQMLQARMMPQMSAPTGQMQSGMGYGQQQGGQMPANPQITWAITRAEKNIYDQIFDAWDGLNRGFISGEVAAEMFRQSGLSAQDLELIWHLSDPEDRGRLNKSEFAVAMHLVYRRLSGYQTPDKLPPELVPPSTRNLSESVSTLRNMLKSDASQRRSSPLQAQQTGVSYMKARSFHSPVNSTEPKHDATVFKNNDDEAALYVSSSRRRAGGRNGADRNGSTDNGSPARELSKGETLESLRKQVREKQILLNAIDAEDDLAFNEDQYLDSRDRDEADDLIRKIRRMQEDIDDYSTDNTGADTGSEKAALRNQLQYLTDRLPVLVGRARSIGNKISDAKLELFRMRDLKAHPGAQIIGTGPGGRVTEADKRKARSMAVLQARMAALTGKPAPAGADGADDMHGAEIRLAEETNAVRLEKEQNEKMIRDVEESVRAVQESIESVLRESRQDFKAEREKQLFEEGIGAEDEVKELILELQERKARSHSRASASSSSARASTATTAREPNHSSAEYLSPVHTSTAAPVAETPTGASAGSGSFYSQFRSPEERSQWIKAEAARRMTERLAALGISRPNQTGSSSAFSAPAPEPSVPTTAPASERPVAMAVPAQQANAFAPPPPKANVFAPPPPQSTFSPPQPQASAFSPPPPQSSAFSPPQSQANAFSAPVPVKTPQLVSESTNPYFSPPAQHTQPSSSRNTRNPFPIQDDEPYYGPPRSTAANHAAVDFTQQQTAASVVAEPIAAPAPDVDFYLEEDDVKTDPSPEPLRAWTPSPSPSPPPPAPVQQIFVPPTRTQPPTVADPPVDRAALDAQRRQQRGHIGADDDDWSVVPSEDESSDDDSPSVVGSGSNGGKKPSPAALASLLFGSMAPTQHASPAPPSPSTAAVSAPPPPPPIPAEFDATPPQAPPAPPIFGAPMPPPPPPAPEMPAMPPPGGMPDRGALLGQIAAGRKLKRVQTVEKGTTGGVGRVL